MINIGFSNNLILLDSIEYQLESIIEHDDSVVNLHLVNDVYNTYYTIVANNVTINGILQTSAQMIIDTLSSDGQS